MIACFWAEVFTLVLFVNVAAEAIVPVKMSVVMISVVRDVFMRLILLLDSMCGNI